jgi:hypothetical protein
MCHFLFILDWDNKHSYLHIRLQLSLRPTLIFLIAVVLWQDFLGACRIEARTRACPTAQGYLSCATHPAGILAEDGKNDNLFCYSVALQNNNKILSLFMSFFILYEKEFRDLFYCVIKNTRKELPPRGLAASSYIQAAAYSGSLLLLLLAALSGPIRASFSLQIDKLAYSVCVCVCSCAR